LSRGGRLRAVIILALAAAGLSASPLIVLGAGPNALVPTLQAAQAALDQGRVQDAARDLQSMAGAVPAAGVIAAELRSGQQVRAGGQLRLLKAAISTQPSASTAVSKQLAQVYASGQLAGIDRPAAPTNSLLSDLANFLRQVLLDIFTGGGRLLWSLLGLIVLGAGAALAVVLIQRSRSRLPDGADRALPGAAAAPRERPERLFASADQLLQAGRFRDAVRASFQALLISAGERRVLQVDPSWTNSELLQQARQVADLEPALRPLVAQFNAVVYGGRDPGAQGCSQFNAACRAAAGGLAR